MKKFYTLACATIILFAGCQKEDQFDINIDDENYTNSSQNRGGGGGLYPSNQMVIRYDSAISEVEKQNMRNQYGVASYETCKCADPNLELWIFQEDPNGNLPGGGTIEEIIVGAKDDSGLEGADFNPYIKQKGQRLQVAFGHEDMGVALTKVNSANENVTIAVLDTGVDYNYFGFNEPFLYNSQQGGDACRDDGMDDYFGWDFVNKDNNPYDGHGHGTVVSQIIYSELNSNNTNFQILPVKVFDDEGNGRYFDILCGFKYAINKQDVAVVNMSFGWYNNGYDLLEDFVMESFNRAILTTSAGNDAINNDQVPHYPSSYGAQNILAVAGLSANYPFVELASYSNYGVNSVDIAARSEAIPFYVTPTDHILVSGTSFANAYAAAFCGLQYVPGNTVPQHFSNVVSNTNQHPNLTSIKYRSYIYY